MLGEIAPRVRPMGLGSTDVISGSKTFTGGVSSNPSGGLGNEVYGLSAVILPAFPLATGNTAIGYRATVQTAANDTVSIGNNANVYQTGAIAIGTQAVTVGLFSVAIGRTATINSGNAYSIAIGYTATTTAANQCVIGGTIATGPIYSFYLGHGITDVGAATAVTVTTTGGSGTDKAGSDLIVAGGASTGAGAAGQVRLQVSPVATTGAGANVPTDRLVIDVNGNVILNGGGAALATNAVRGFTYIPTCAGPPTGTPTVTPTGTVPMVFDSTNNFLYFYNSGWKKSTVYA